jgi:inhibitor of cysteine peptidase
LRQRLVALLLAGLIAAACAAPGSAGTTIELDAADSGSSVPASVGTSIVIALEANPTTGYTWQLQPGLDESVVRFVSEDYQQDPSGYGAVGAGGVDTLTFEAVGEGSTTIVLGYQRSGDPAPTDSFTVSVEVDG